MSERHHLLNKLFFSILNVAYKSHSMQSSSFHDTKHKSFDSGDEDSNELIRNTETVKEIQQSRGNVVWKLQCSQWTLCSGDTRLYEASKDI